MKNKILIVAVVVALSGCTTMPQTPPEEIIYSATTSAVEENPVPGTVNEFWEEPMYDMVDVPAQLDPNGVYYRPRHREIVEIRPGRYQQAEYPPDSPRGNHE